jgi:hypothetical protein
MTTLFLTPCIARADNVRIVEVDNINLGTWGMTSMTGNDAVCVYRSNNNVNYTVNATDNSIITPSAFYFEDTTAHTSQIPFTLNWSNTTSPGTLALSDGVTRSATGANITSSNCGGGDSANFKIDVNNSAMAGVPAGTYKTTITFVIGQ